MFERGDALKQFVDGQKWRATSQSNEGHFEGGARLTATYDVVETSREALMQAGQIVRVDAFG